MTHVKFLRSLGYLVSMSIWTGILFCMGDQNIDPQVSIPTLSELAARCLARSFFTPGMRTLERTFGVVISRYHGCLPDQSIEQLSRAVLADDTPYHIQIENQSAGNIASIETYLSPVCDSDGSTREGLSREFRNDVGFFMKEGSVFPLRLPCQAKQYKISFQLMRNNRRGERYGPLGIRAGARLCLREHERVLYLAWPMIIRNLASITVQMRLGMSMSLRAFNGRIEGWEKPRVLQEGSLHRCSLLLPFAYLQMTQKRLLPMMQAEIWLDAAREVNDDEPADLTEIFNSDLIVPIRKELTMLQIMSNENGIVIEQLGS